jgi:cell division protein FtsB
MFIMSLETWSGSKSAPESLRRSLPRAGSRIAMSLYAGLAVYCVLSVLCGPAGLTAYRRLEERKGAMQANLVALESIRGKLAADLGSLKSDPDRLAREARRLGYLREGETALILGDSTERAEAIETGRILPYAEPPSVGDMALKQISLGVCLAVMAFLFARKDPEARPRR